jgi:outer membrane biosynthesis protein TonB
MIGVVAVLLLVGFAWFYSAYFGGTDRNETPTQIIATLTPMDPSELNIPTPTPKPPTPTPEPTEEPSPTPTEEIPTPTPTEEIVEQQPQVAEEPVQDVTEEVVVDEEPVNYDVASDQPDSSVVASVSVIAQGEIYISVVVDGAPAYEGTLQAGESTPYFNGSNIVVYTTDGGLTTFSSATTPGGFSMGGEGEQTYTFP